MSQKLPPSRMSATDIVLNRAAGLEQQAKSLRALVAALPRELPPQAEQALFDLLGRLP